MLLLGYEPAARGRAGPGALEALALAVPPPGPAGCDLPGSGASGGADLESSRANAAAKAIFARLDAILRPVLQKAMGHVHEGCSCSL